jgi:hypothetical protein
VIDTSPPSFLQNVVPRYADQYPTCYFYAHWPGRLSAVKRSNCGLHYSTLETPYDQHLVGTRFLIVNKHIKYSIFPVEVRISRSKFASRTGRGFSPKPALSTSSRILNYYISAKMARTEPTDDQALFAASGKGVMRQLRENPYIFGLASVSSIHSGL